MKSTTTLILESGIKDLLREDEISFKKSLINSLSLKLNESIKEIQNDFKSTMMLNVEKPVCLDDIKNFNEFVENYDNKTKNKIKFKNGSHVIVNENDFKNLKEMFDTLNSKNRLTFVEEIMESPAKLKNNLEFYKKAKRILK
jgi:hypothetical protein